MLIFSPTETKWSFIPCIQKRKHTRLSNLNCPLAFLSTSVGSRQLHEVSGNLRALSIVWGRHGRRPSPSSNIQLLVKGGMLSVSLAVLVDSLFGKARTQYWYWTSEYKATFTPHQGKIFCVFLCTVGYKFLCFKMISKAFCSYWGLWLLGVSGYVFLLRIWYCCWTERER